MNIKDFPKIELHLHLDGSVNINTASKLLNKDVKNEMIAKDKCLDLNEYLTKFDLPISIMQTKDNLKLIAKELGESLIKDNVLYAEIRFAPLLHTKTLSLDEVLDSVIDGLNETNIKYNLILCMMRHMSYEDNKKVIDIAYKYLNNHVCAIDLAGAEGLYKTSNFKELFDYAYNLNIPFTIHAGEADGIDSINSAIDFHTKRIGHGIRCIEDINTLNRIKDNNITLEICPTSNVQTNVIDKYENHPIRYLYDNNIKITINTDNRTVSNISLSEEYNKLIQTFNFTKQDLIKINYNAIDSSFLSPKEKELLKEEYNSKL